MKDDNLMKALTVLVIAIGLFVIGLLVYDVVGHTTQESIVTEYIVEKNHYVTQTPQCTTANNVTTCTPTLVSHWELYTESGTTLYVTKDVYMQVKEGKTHVFRATG